VPFRPASRARALWNTPPRPGGPGSRPSAPIGEHLTAPWPDNVKRPNRWGPAARFPEPRPARRAPPPRPRPPPLPRRSAPRLRDGETGAEVKMAAAALAAAVRRQWRALRAAVPPRSPRPPRPPRHLSTRRSPRSGLPSSVRAVAGRAGGALIRPPARRAGPPGRGHTLGGEAAVPARSRPSVWGPGGGGGGGGRGIRGREGDRGAGRQRERLVPGSGARRRYHDVHPFRGPPAAGHRGPAQWQVMGRGRGTSLLFPLPHGRAGGPTAPCRPGVGQTWEPRAAGRGPARCGRGCGVDGPARCPLPLPRGASLNSAEPGAPGPGPRNPY
jgi:hypothetical protein